MTVARTPPGQANSVNCLVSKEGLDAAGVVAQEITRIDSSLVGHLRGNVQKGGKGHVPHE